MCEEVSRPLSVVSGAAGTGKTTVINALLQAIERSDGRGATFQLLAPTGKAAERLRDATDKRYPTATIHSFLAQHAWLNDNLTFRRRGGKREDSVTTMVVDEGIDAQPSISSPHSFAPSNGRRCAGSFLVGDPGNCRRSVAGGHSLM